MAAPAARRLPESARQHSAAVPAAVRLAEALAAPAAAVLLGLVARGSPGPALQILPESPEDRAMQVTAALAAPLPQELEAMEQSGTPATDRVAVAEAATTVVAVRAKSMREAYAPPASSSSHMAAYPRYQFFPLYQAMPNLFIKEEEHDNRFTIGGGIPGGQVSWQITGIRHDAYILAHPIIVEVLKGPNQPVNRGECLFPPLCQ